MMRRLHLVVSAVLIAMGSAPSTGPPPDRSRASVRDYGRSSADWRRGAVAAPRPDRDRQRLYRRRRAALPFPRWFPAVMRSRRWAHRSCPSLRENVRVRASTVVNLTLNTLYEVMQWLPSEPRAGSAPEGRLGMDAALGRQSSAAALAGRWPSGGGFRRVRDGAEAEGAADGYRAGGNFWRKRGTLYGDGGRYAGR